MILRGVYIAAVVIITWQLACASGLSAEPAPTDTLQDTLNEPVEFKFAATPLTDAIQTLQKKYRVPLKIDEPALTNIEFNLKTPVTFRAAGISLGQALRRMLADHGLAILPRDGRLLITTKEMVDKVSEVRLYPVLDLTPPRESNETLLLDAHRELNDVLTAMIDPASWPVESRHRGQFLNGPGQPKPAPIPYLRRAGLLVVSQRPDNHRRIAELLALLRRVRDQQFAAGKLKPQANRSLEPVSMPDEVDPALRRALAVKQNFDIKRVALQAALESLADKTGVPIYLDRFTLAQANVSLDEPVWLQADDTSLAEGLNQLLHPHNLGWRIDDQLILVTTKNVAAESKTIRIYPVADLVELSNLDGWDDSLSARTQMLERIWSQINPKTSDEVKPVTYFSSAAAWVVSQTDDRHRELQSLLTALRDARAKQFPASADGKTAGDSKKLVTKIYRAPAAYLRNPNSGGFRSETDPIEPQLYSADELVRLVLQVIEPQSWKSAGGAGTIQPIADRLVVQQTEQVHQQIAKLFRSLQARE